MLLGAMFVYVLAAEIFPAVGANFPERQPYAAAVFDILMQGVRAAGRSSSNEFDA